MHLNRFNNLPTLSLAAALVCACIPESEPEPTSSPCASEDCEPDEAPSDDESPPGDEAPPDDIDDLDDEPPRIVQISPPDGTIGIGPTVTIVIEFSEPMDLVATEAAYSSKELPAEAVSMIWNAAGDTLTIRPNQELEFGEGNDPAETVALRYSFELGTTARDLAGNTLAEPVHSSFDTLRRLRVSLAAVAEWTGSITADDHISYRDKCTVGDNLNDDTVKFLAGFDLGALPEALAKLESAHLVAEQRFVTTKTVYDDLGSMVVEQVVFEELEQAFAVPGTVLGVLSRSPELGRRRLPIAQAFANADAWSDQKLQVRLAFEHATDHNADADLVFLGCDSVALEVAYLLP